MRRALAAIAIAAIACACGERRASHGDAASAGSAAVVTGAGSNIVAAGAGSNAGSATVASAPPAPPPNPARLEHVAWRFVDNRHAAHRAIGGELVVDAGDIGFARYTRFGMPAPRWRLGQTIDGVRAAIADRLASIEVPLPVAAHTAALQIRLRVHASAKLKLALDVNGRHIGRALTLQPGWQTVAIAAPPGTFVVGENPIALQTLGKPGAAQLALAWLRIGAPAASADADADPLAAAAFVPAADALELAQNAELAWYLTIPDGANLVADVAPPCRVEVAARAGDDSLTAGLLGGDSHRVDLSPSAGKVVRLALIARDCPRARVVHAAITLHGAGVPLAAPGAPSAPAPPPRFIVLWTIDGLRADRLAAFAPSGAATAKTPNLDELARASAIFRQVYAQSPAPQPSYASLWTSRYAPAALLDPRLPTIASELAAAGYAELHAVADLAHHRDRPAYAQLDTTIAASAGCTPAGYDAAVADQDRQLGQLVAQLKAWGIWDQTMLVVTSDRGEELADDGQCTAAGLTRDAVVHVPLLVRDPDRFAAGSIADDGADLVDVLPTLLAAVGRPSPDGVQGAPLEQAASRGWPKPSYASDDDTMHVMRIGRWKLSVYPKGAPAVDDFVADPDESKDLAFDHPIERRMLTDNLGLFLALRASWRRAAWGVTTSVTSAGAAAMDDAATP